MGGVTIYIYFLRLTFFYWSISSKLVSTHTDSTEALLKIFWSVESKFIPCYTVKKLQNWNCALHGVGVVIKKYLFLRRWKLLKFHTDSPHVMMFMINKFHKNLFLEWPKIFEYLVVKRKNCNNFDYSLYRKSWSLNIQWLDSHQLTILVFQVNLSCYEAISHNIP